MKRTPLRRTGFRTERLVRTATVPAFPKPKDVYRETPAVIYYPDGREVCNIRTTAGTVEYKKRVSLMVQRQKDICCLYGFCPHCPQVLTGYVSTFEHENGRGGGKRDDRIELPDGRWINGAAHVVCNQWKGSRRIKYNGNSPSSQPR
jgi:hypothetical protein